MIFSNLVVTTQLVTCMKTKPLIQLREMIAAALSSMTNLSKSFQSFIIETMELFRQSKLLQVFSSGKVFSRIVRNKAGFGLAVVVFAALIVEGISLLQYGRLRKLVMQAAERQSMVELWTKTEIINHTLESAEATIHDHLWDLSRNLPYPDSMFSVARRLVETNPDIVGGFITFIPGYYPGKGELFEPYARKSGGTVKVSQIASADHDYTANPDYLKVLAEDRGHWTDPYHYVDESEMDLTTYSCPLKDGSGRTVGVCGIDIDLSWLGDTLNVYHSLPSSFTIVLTREGKPFAGPSGSRVAGQVVRLLHDGATVPPQAGSARAGMIAFRDSLSGDKVLLYYASRKDEPQWQVAQVIFEKELYGNIRKNRFIDFLLTLIALTALFLMIERFARNEKRLRDAYVDQARIGNELHIARRIQEEMLPKKFPPFPDRTDVDIFGSLKPAREVGGDIFDFFIRDGKLFFVVGDVSGKGIPAAIVMAMIHSMFSLASASEDDPVKIVKAVNAEGCRNNSAGMFVTCFIGVLNLSSGRLRYCNAGHDRPLLVGCAVEELPANANLPVGVLPDVQFEGQECRIAPGTTVFLYTDGLTEAKDTSRRMFGKDRVIGILGRFISDPAAAAADIVSAADREVETFISGTEQEDDLTMLAIRYNGNAAREWEESIVLRNDLGQVKELNGFVKSVTGRLGIGKDEAARIRLAVEEVVVNVIEYAYPEGHDGEVQVDARPDGRSLVFTVTDSGRPFDPTKVPAPDTGQPAELRTPGGLGIFIARELMDSIEYARRDGKNVLTLRKDLRNGARHGVQHRV